VFYHAAGFAQADAAFQAGVATTAIAGQHFDAIQRGYQVALDPAGVESFGALQAAVDVDQEARVTA
jgi:ATP-dependent DNA ligase